MQNIFTLTSSPPNTTVALPQSASASPLGGGIHGDESFAAFEAKAPLDAAYVVTDSGLASREFMLFHQTVVYALCRVTLLLGPSKILLQPLADDVVMGAQHWAGLGLPFGVATIFAPQDFFDGVS